ncbi:hypothetical protein RO3G_05874 [Rhizopus delemar RA 99-880]|uniref:Spo11/DNA topoisomerase VI subunit A N-terminal domain-containing protein n=1 Tax=Rhizopus delemar (strain RA 99-880 / ATCC MYA-4621 / FGSC 9543 / NRRL 43880) TaxID=246409 RepID=I1BY89_RHIO9|nr:hypothetical protein RO3G_05874 [Rhizopus delemar RA 99-880]|eukprot:EIE81169.1 hypothetical protein RO3G_05874 [Rhizopus delemar RA 99-880]
MGIILFKITKQYIWLKGSCTQNAFEASEYSSSDVVNVKIPKRLFSVINTPNANSTVNKPRETIMHEIEQTILDVVQSLSMGEPIQVPASTRKSRSKRKKTDSSSSQQQNKENGVASYQTRRLKLSSERSTRALARYLSVLRMIYEALAYKIVVTKRDMFYRDVELFHTQSVSAASKGLVFGSIVIKLKNNKMLDCMTRINKLDCHDVQGLLIPPASEIAEIQCKARCMIIIEKEGKGYPDLATRQFAFAFDVFNLAFQYFKPSFYSSYKKRQIKVPQYGQDTRYR